ncbi:hypothetical protein P879_08222 [Paragonimus westermani]|uniref:SOCS box domain-containing protein n=1 Tax=Paragonimus westermani TaxID=34504 RepID=A0A8T0DEB3_9TREM|nr:hypothetical protein P879_08222 [Paragonimus westermani]
MCALPGHSMMLPSVRILESGTNEDLHNLVRKVDLVRMRDADNNTLLHHACLLGNLEAVRLLIDSGLHPDIGNVDGQTPLCDAALHGSTDIVSLLLSSGVDVNPLSYWGSPLMYATQNENLGAMQLLINAGAELNSPDRSGFCPLHVAVRRQFYAGARALLLGGADPNCRARLTTPLHLAAKLDDLFMASILLAHGAYPTPLDMDNFTPVDYAPKGSRLHQMLNAVQHNVPSLQSIARLTVRNKLRPPKLEALGKLNLPPSLCDYLTFNRL